MVSEDRKSITFFSLLTVHCSLFTVMLLLACQTAPKFPDVSLTETVPLEAGASAYIIADAKEAKQILELLPIEGLKNKQVKQMMEKTDFLVVAVYPPESGKRLQIAATGSYPSAQAGMALSFNKDWKKQRAESGAYWYSVKDKFSIALDSKQAFAASWLDTPASPIAAGAEIPEGFNEFRHGTTISLWLPDPGPKMNKLLDSMGIPFQIPAERLLAGLFPVQDKYEMVIRMQFPAAAQARGIASLLSLARNFPPSFSADNPNSVLAAVFFANPPVQDGQNINIKSAPLSENEVALLFRMFLLY
ncbi:MAG: hypothetical protein LBH44_04550 [Treponema sp.]|jgi:hypothetical protein|nr:hypothetical protein [Treponema sp.]